MPLTSLHCCLLVACALALMQCHRPDTMEHPYTNQLINETSPYLLQHAHNPVDWYPWGDEALAKAKAENKLLLISIGYSSCHWCHVMEHESFEDTTVAAVMNAHFVCIKVDREERPDIDDVYMMACQLASGGGCGWPLNSFALPDGRPVWAGTYFPKSRWLEILAYFYKTYTDEPEKMEDYASRLVAGVRDHGLDSLAQQESSPVTTADIHQLANQFMQSMDPIMGGRRGSPKFPMPNNWDFLMHYAHRYNNQRAADLVKTTLDKMMRGGIYDQLEGGFARYATDSMWLIPHFEKMLYDNGQLISTYAHAYAWTRDEQYLGLVRQTADFAMTYWSDKAGGFYSSYDADSEKEEGKYYVWTTDELEQLIPDEQDRKVFYAYHDIKPEGNWEHRKNILQQHKRMEEVARSMQMDSADVRDILHSAYKKLIAARSKRVMPGLDDKVLASWNALMLNGLIDAYHVSGEERYQDRALANANFLLEHLVKVNEGYRMDRNYKNGKSTINGFLDDYAITISAFINLYQSTFDTAWLTHANGLTQHVIDHFAGNESGMFYYTSDLDPPLVARRIEYSDNVIPSANSTMARNLLTLGNILYHQEYIDRAQQMLMTVWGRIQQDAQPSFYSNWCQLAIDVADPPFEVAIVGNNAVVRLAELRTNYLPHAIYIGGKNEGSLPLLKNKTVENQTFIYVCRNKVCKLPTTEVSQALMLLAE